MNRFERTPHDLLRDSAITLQARAVYPILRDLIWERTGESGHDVRGELPALHALAREIGCSQTALKGYLTELRQAGWISTVRKSRDRPQLYIVHAARGTEYVSPVRRNPSRSPLTDATDSTGSKDPVLPATVVRPIFDALVEATHANPSSDRGMIGQAGRHIKIAMEDAIRDLTHAYLAQNPHEDEVPWQVVDELVAGEIRIRADLYRQLRPEWELTPTALAKHWNRIPIWRPQGMRPADIAKLRDEDFGVG